MRDDLTLTLAVSQPGRRLNAQVFEMSYKMTLAQIANHRVQTCYSTIKSR